MRYNDPSGHQTGIPWVDGPLRLAQTPTGQHFWNQITIWWNQAQALWVQCGPFFMQGAQDWVAQGPALIDKTGQTGKAWKGAANQAGNTAGPGGLDPNKFDPEGKTFRNAAERFQFQTSGTRFGGETQPSVRIDGTARTIDVDGIVGNYLHESKYIDITLPFYGKQIGNLGSGLRLHVTQWSSELERLATAAEQYGYQGVKVFVNEPELISMAQEVFSSEPWFQIIQSVQVAPR